jgi:hypothetical protein
MKRNQQEQNYRLKTEQSKIQKKIDASLAETTELILIKYPVSKIDLTLLKR